MAKQLRVVFHLFCGLSRMFAAVKSSSDQHPSWTSSDVEGAIERRDAETLRRLGIVAGDACYIQSVLSRTDKDSVCWFEETFPDSKLDYNRMLLIAANNQPIEFLGWLVSAKNADMRLLQCGNLLESSLVLKTSLINMKWIVKHCGIVVPPGHGDYYFSRAVMYDLHEDVVQILEWLYSFGLIPGPESLEYALRFSADPYASVLWLANHGATFTDRTLSCVVSRIYQRRDTATAVVKLTEWLLDVYHLKFTEAYMLEILEKSYIDESVPLLRWAIQKQLPRGAEVDKWVAKESEPKQYDHRPELKREILKLLSDPTP
jgi:hypothetical protein